jgi:hypothetical protein
LRYLPRYVPSASITAAVLKYCPACTNSYIGSTITIPSSLATLWNRLVVGPSGIGSV